jgi:hypothetical protein
MKYRKRSITCNLLAGLIVSIVSCNQKQSQAELLSVKALDSFPSASAIEFSDGRFYVLGDDAPYMIVLDSSFHLVDTVRYSEDTSYRISKEVKADIESATIIPYTDQKFLYALGSFATDRRMKLFYFPLGDPHHYVAIDMSKHFRSHPYIPETNFEGLAFVNSKLVIANRGNRTHKINKLVIAGSRFNEYIATDSPPVIDILLDTTTTIGISGLCYSEEEDKLFFTASEEDTPSAIADGVIGDSYIGWINRFSTRMNERSIKPDGVIKLSSIDKTLDKKKIESVCIEKQTGDAVILDLVSDDDKGHSAIFRIRLYY